MKSPTLWATPLFILSFLLPAKALLGDGETEAVVGWDYCRSSFRLMRMMFEGDLNSELWSWKSYILAGAWLANIGFGIAALSSMFQGKGHSAIVKVTAIVSAVLAIVTVGLAMDDKGFLGLAPLAWSAALMLCALEPSRRTEDDSSTLESGIQGLGASLLLLCAAGGLWAFVDSRASQRPLNFWAESSVASDLRTPPFPPSDTQPSLSGALPLSAPPEGDRPSDLDRTSRSTLLGLNEEYRTSRYAISVTQAAIAPTRVGNDSVSTEPNLQFRLSIRNVHDRKVLVFRNESMFSPRFDLQDDVGNEIRGVAFGFRDVVGSLGAREDLYPGKSASHVLVFAVPPPKTKYLILSVDLSAFDDEGSATFKIPFRSISRSGDIQGPSQRELSDKKYDFDFVSFSCQSRGFHSSLFTWRFKVRIHNKSSTHSMKLNVWDKVYYVLDGNRHALGSPEDSRGNTVTVSIPPGQSKEVYYSDLRSDYNPGARTSLAFIYGDSDWLRTD